MISRWTQMPQALSNGYVIWNAPYENRKQRDAAEAAYVQLCLTVLRLAQVGRSSPMSWDPALFRRVYTSNLQEPGEPVFSGSPAQHDLPEVRSSLLFGGRMTRLIGSVQRMMPELNILEKADKESLSEQDSNPASRFRKYNLALSDVDFQLLSALKVILKRKTVTAVIEDALNHFLARLEENTPVSTFVPPMTTHDEERTNRICCRLSDHHREIWNRATIFAGRRRGKQCLAISAVIRELARKLEIPIPRSLPNAAPTTTGP